MEGLIHLDGRDAPFSGRVAWARPGDPRMNLMGRMGVRFLEIDPEFARSLAAADDPSTRPDEPEAGSSRATP
jgi:hypothetical protein